MKHTSFLTTLVFFLSSGFFFLPATVNAQGDSAKNFRENKAQFMVPLGDLIAEMEKDAQVKITFTDAVKPYLSEPVVMAPWKFWNDPKLRLAYMLAPLDLSFEQIDEKTFQIIEPRYHIRPEAEAKSHLDRLLGQYSNKELWEKRVETLKTTIAEKFHLNPIPREVLKPRLGEKRAYDGYTVRNVALEILPGYFVNGNLYEPLTEGKHPAILCPHGHGELGRFGEDQQIRSAVLARMGAVVFAYSMFAWREEESPLLHTDHNDQISGPIQTLQTIRSIDWLETLPNVDATRIGITGCSGGGTQTFMGTAMDPRITVSVPVVMPSAHFFGGCPCESGIPFHILHGLTCNIEIAAMGAPRPMKLICVTQDWTKNTPEVEFPYVQKIYGYYGAEQNVEYAIMDEPHNYGPSKRAEMYPFMAKHLGLNMDQCDETKVTVEPLETMLYWGPDHVNYPADAVQTLDDLKKVFYK